jgi:hypothetical protein
VAAVSWQRPGWLRDGVVFVGQWEPLIYRRRGGGARTDEAERFEMEHSEEAVEQLADLGVNLVITHYHKGFGPAAEQGEYDLIRKLRDRCHARGIKLGVYLRLDTLAYETLLLEHPEAKDWFQVNWDGQYPVYNDNSSGDLYYRRQACPCCEEYLAWIEERLRFAVEELKVDLIHFDGVMPYLEGYQCYCDRCKADFRRYLQQKYADPEVATERFGFPDLSQVLPPVYIVHPYHRHSPKDLREVRDPVMQEWTRYRCEKLAQVHHRLARFIRALNPEVAVEVNTLMPLEHNHYFRDGLDLALIGEENDCMWTEDEHHPRLTDDGVLISRIREFKIGRTLNNIVFSYHPAQDPADLKRCLGQALAFNAQTIGMVGGMPVSEDHWSNAASGPGVPEPNWPTPYEVKRQWIRFRKQHAEHYLDTESVGGVALLRARDSLSYSMTKPHHHTLLWEQVLIQSGLPFDIIFDQQLDDPPSPSAEELRRTSLSKYQVLVLPSTECMAEGMMAKVRSFVAAGGGLVASGDASARDEWRRWRPDLVLRDVLGPIAGRGSDPWYATRHAYGEGRAAYVSEVVTEEDISHWHGLGDSQWKLPRNVYPMRQALLWAAHGRLPIWLDGPDTVVAEFLAQPGKYLAHLVNFDLTRSRHDLQINLRLPKGGRVRSAFALDPESRRPEKLRAEREGEVTTIGVPTLEIYKLVVIQTK